MLWRLESSEIADLGDERSRYHQADFTWRLQSLHQRRQRPAVHHLLKHVVQAIAPGLCLLNAPDAFTEDELLISLRVLTRLCDQCSAHPKVARVLESLIDHL